MQRITPHLWFDTQAKEAAELYTSLFPDSEIRSAAVLRDTPSGDAQTVSFTIAGYEVMAISAGPYFTINPSVSFMLNYDPSMMDDAEQKLRTAWAALTDGGSVLVPLGKYPYSELFGWVQDRYGVCWELILTDPAGEDRPFLIPSLMFVGDVCGKAEEATDFYLDVFGNSRRGTLSRYGEGQAPDQEGTVNFTDFQLEGQWFTAMDSAQPHQFTFNEGVSLMVNCETQDEIDEYWDKLSAVPEAEQCGWCKDKYGVSWQIVPKRMSEMMANGSPAQIDRVTQAFLPMKKFDLQVLVEAYRGPQ
jgi:predicted 3-demethylubiquinone-9 3-methyltransferase (glyoxalase superfamily)